MQIFLCVMFAIKVSIMPPMYNNQDLYNLYPISFHSRIIQLMESIDILCTLSLPLYVPKSACLSVFVFQVNPKIQCFGTE